MSIAALYKDKEGKYIALFPEADIRSFIGWTCGRNEELRFFDQGAREHILMACVAIGVAEVPDRPLFSSAKEMMDFIAGDKAFEDLPRTVVKDTVSARALANAEGISEFMVLTTKGLYLVYAKGADTTDFRVFFVPKDKITDRPYWIGIKGRLGELMTVTSKGQTDPTVIFRAMGMIASLHGVDIKSMVFGALIKATYDSVAVNSSKSWAGSSILC